MAEKRQTPMTGAEQNKNTRERRPELPAKEDNEKLQERLKEANHTANQTIEDGNENEVQGKAAIPFVKVQQRGQTKWTDEKTGELHKVLNDAEPNERIAEEEKPEYLKLHEEVLNGADPLEATLKYQKKDSKDSFAEGKLSEAETNPRTHGLGPSTAAPEAEEQRAAKVETDDRD